MLRPFYTRDKNLVPTEMETGWIPKVSGDDKPFLDRESQSGPSSSGLVASSTTLTQPTYSLLYPISIPSFLIYFPHCPWLNFTCPSCITCHHATQAPLNTKQYHMTGTQNTMTQQKHLVRLPPKTQELEKMCFRHIVFLYTNIFFSKRFCFR